MQIRVGGSIGHLQTLSQRCPMLRIKVGGVQKLVLEMETRPRTEPFRIHKVSATIYTKTQHNRISALSFFKARFFSHISLTEAFDTASSLATIKKIYNIISHYTFATTSGNNHDVPFLHGNYYDVPFQFKAAYKRHTLGPYYNEQFNSQKCARKKRYSLHPNIDVSQKTFF